MMFMNKDVEYAVIGLTQVLERITKLQP